jgi:hypothetical protein
MPKLQFRRQFIAGASQGCQIFLDKTYQKRRQIYQITIKLPNAIKYANGRTVFQMAIKIHQHFSFQDPPKFSQIGIFGLKIGYHLAALVLHLKDAKGPASVATLPSRTTSGTTRSRTRVHEMQKKSRRGIPIQKNLHKKFCR